MQEFFEYPGPARLMQPIVSLHSCRTITDHSISADIPIRIFNDTDSFLTLCKDSGQDRSSPQFSTVCVVYGLQLSLPGIARTHTSVDYTIHSPDILPAALYPSLALTRLPTIMKCTWRLLDLRDGLSATP